jgi:hypothetical protein
MLKLAMLKIQRAYGGQKKQLSNNAIEKIKAFKYKEGVKNERDEILKIIWAVVDKPNNNEQEAIARALFYRIKSRG